MYYGKTHSTVSHRIPAEENKYLKSDDFDAFPVNIHTDDYYYAGVGGVWDLFAFSDKINISTPIYQYVDGNGSTHYFSEYEKAGNHS